MKKRIFLTAICALALLAAVACGGKDGANQSSSSPEQTSSSMDEVSSSIQDNASSSAEETASSEDEASSVGGESSSSEDETSSLTSSPEADSSLEEDKSSSEDSSPETDSSFVADSSMEASSEEDSSVEDSNTVQVTFDSDGGTEVKAVILEKGEKVEKPENPQKINETQEYEFLGWYYGEEEWDFENDVVTQNITLVAKWKLVEQYTKPFLPKD